MELIKASEVAKQFNVSLRTVNRWIEAGYFSGAFRRNPRAANSTYLIPVDSVEKFKREREQTAKD